MNRALEYYHIAPAAVSRHQMGIGDSSVESRSGMFHVIKIKCGFEEEQQRHPGLEIVNIEITLE